MVSDDQQRVKPPRWRKDERGGRQGCSAVEARVPSGIALFSLARPCSVLQVHHNPFPNPSCFFRKPVLSGRQNCPRAIQPRSCPLPPETTRLAPVAPLVVVVLPIGAGCLRCGGLLCRGAPWLFEVRTVAWAPMGSSGKAPTKLAVGSADNPPCVWRGSTQSIGAHLGWLSRG